MHIAIIDLERTAVRIGTANIQMKNGAYLTVRYFPGTKSYQYQYRNQKLSRDEAIKILAKDAET